MKLKVEMTLEELDVAIAEIIIPQEKPKNTGNSHRRKQWENEKYWHLCTKWKSCKVGKAKNANLSAKDITAFVKIVFVFKKL